MPTSETSSELKTTKKLESSLRRKAAKRGYILRKARIRNPDVWWHGTYCLVDANRNCLILGMSNQGGFGMSLDDISEFLANNR